VVCTGGFVTVAILAVGAVVFAPWLSWVAWSPACAPSVAGLRPVLVWMQVVGLGQTMVVAVSGAMAWRAEWMEGPRGQQAVFVPLMHVFQSGAIAWLIRSCC
jgi:hypothetical protein